MPSVWANELQRWDKLINRMEDMMADDDVVTAVNCADVA